jgi:hypothetical protein
MLGKMFVNCTVDLEIIFLTALRESSIYVFAVKKPQHFYSISCDFYAKPEIIYTYPEICVISLDLSNIFQVSQSVGLLNSGNNLQKILFKRFIMCDLVNIFVEFFGVKNLHLSFTEFG